MSTEGDRLNTIGALYHKSGDINAALRHYSSALELDPDHSEAMANLCAGLLSAKNYYSALMVGKRAVALYPKSITARRNYAKALMFCGKFKESAAEHADLVNTTDSFPDWYDYALLLSHLNEHHMAIGAYSKTLELLQEESNAGDVKSVIAGDDIKKLELETPQAILQRNIIQDRSISKLGIGDFHGGLNEYVTSDGSSAVKNFQVERIPRWQGEDICGKRILVYGWGGFGDSIMCLRYLRLLKDRGAKITVAVSLLLSRLVMREGYDVYN